VAASIIEAGGVGGGEGKRGGRRAGKYSAPPYQ
jgi:hypothetical protein